MSPSERGFNVFHVIRTLALLALAAAFLPTANADDKPTPKIDDKAVVVPIELLPSRHFVVQVMLNGKGPYRLILDTGAPLTIINSRIAKDAGLTKKSGGGGGILGMLTSGLNQVAIAKMQVGDVVAEKSGAVIMDHPTVSAISEAFEKDSGPIDGIVGFPFFARFAMTVDYQKKEVTFKPNGYKPGDYMQDLTNSLMKIEERNKPRSVTSAGLWGFTMEKEKSDEAEGVTVKTVFADSAAAKGGLKVGDRLLTIDGRWTDSIGDTALATSLVKAGKAVAVVVKRDGKDVKLKVTPATGN